MTEIGIKFKCDWEKSESLTTEAISDINHWRNVLYKKNMIGVGADGIGFGNISKRHNSGEFIISGATTGKFETLTNEHYTVVTHFNIETNYLKCKGPIIASSESMTHGVTYTLNNQINAVVHIHHAELWHKYINVLPTTNKDVEYGTPAMAREIIRLYQHDTFSSQKIMVMAGHQDGLLSFGNTLEEAVNLFLNLNK